MKNKAILCIIMCVLASCSVRIAKVPPRYEGVKLIIDTPNNITDGPVTINVSLENNTNYDFYVVDKRYWDMPSCIWGLKIIFQETKQVMVRSELINHGIRSIRESYVFVERGHSYTFQLNVDFRELCSFCRGEYSIKLTYYNRDRYFRHRKVFRGRIESNVLNVVYKP
jgi:hypothetical protein